MMVTADNYMFRLCKLAIVRLYYKLNKKLYNVCVGTLRERDLVSRDLVPSEYPRIHCIASY